MSDRLVFVLLELTAMKLMVQSAGLAQIFLAVIVAGMSLLFSGCGQQSTRNKEPVTLEEMNRVVRMVAMSPGKSFQSIADVTNYPGFQGRKLPVPPPGKKLGLDRSKREVIFVDN